MSGPMPTRVTDRTLPITVLDPIYDDCGWLALVPGDWTRGKAIAAVAEHSETPFTSWRARRVYLRWWYGPIKGGYWQLSEGVLTGCDRSHPEAERYWEVTYASR